MTVRVGEPVMGTVLTVTVTAGDESDARRLAGAAVGEARRWDAILTTWTPAGELARLNAHAGDGPVEVSPDLAAALRTMAALSAATDGAFDPAVGPLVDRWRGPSPPDPPPAATAATRIATALRLDGNRAELQAGAALDAGGIGKGIALDAMAALLRRGGVRAALLYFGGSSQLAIGAPEANPLGWRVAILDEAVARDRCWADACATRRLDVPRRSRPPGRAIRPAHGALCSPASPPPAPATRRRRGVDQGAHRRRPRRLPAAARTASTR